MENRRNIFFKKLVTRSYIFRNIHKICENIPCESVKLEQLIQLPQLPQLPDVRPDSCRALKSFKNQSLLPKKNYSHLEY